MEPQETIYCYDNKEKKCEKKRDCLGIIAVILLAAFSVVIGLIIGALTPRIRTLTARLGESQSPIDCPTK